LVAAPDANDNDPPAPADDNPAVRDTAPPLDTPSPTEIAMSPPAPTDAAPVDNVSVPDEEAVESPVVIDTDPVTPLEDAPAVKMSTLPLADEVLAPDDIFKSPPTPVALPLLIVIYPPEATELVPALKSILPAVAELEYPDETVIEPVEPVEAAPVENDA